MELGEVEVFEVWGLPKNREAYSPCCMQTHDSLEHAQAWRAEVAPQLGGYTLEIIRQRTTRQLMGPT